MSILYSIDIALLLLTFMSSGISSRPAPYLHTILTTHMGVHVHVASYRFCLHIGMHYTTMCRSSRSVGHRVIFFLPVLRPSYENPL
ncbi:hypothetical protein EDD16DRAFT_1597425 [Pisolithus croceorrhizus]|nr:hypothetical protein EDD16DRAFT_1597425 [Pisolithus croceorrhizus]